MKNRKYDRKQIDCQPIGARVCQRENVQHEFYNSRVSIFAQETSMGAELRYTLKKMKKKHVYRQ